MFSLRTFVAVSVAFSAVVAAPTSIETKLMKRLVNDLSHELKNEPTALGRFNLLKGDTNNFIFDFVKARDNAKAGKDGAVVLATAGAFPLAVGNGVAMGVGFIGPCGLNVPHWHPRASELLIAVGGNLTFGTFQEDGATFITGTLGDKQATLFPAGSLHFQQNLECTPAQFYAAFNSEDPGRIDSAPGFFTWLPADIDNAALGDIGVQEVKDIAAKIPVNVAFGVQSCLDKCGLKRAGQWTPAAVDKAKRDFDEFLKQGPISPKDFAGLPRVPSYA